ATRAEIAAAAAAAIAGKCSRQDAAVIIPLVTMSAMLRRGADGGDDEETIAVTSRSSKLRDALERVRNRSTNRTPRVEATDPRVSEGTSAHEPRAHVGAVPPSSLDTHQQPCGRGPHRHDAPVGALSSNPRGAHDQLSQPDAHVGALSSNPRGAHDQLSQ